MDLIKPDGSKQELPKPEETTKPDTAAAKTPEEPQKPALWGQIDANGIMRLEINMAVVSEHNELIDQFVGFMDRHKAVGLAQMVNAQQQRASLRAAVQKTQAKNGFQHLMHKIRGGR
jgi:hypothetical protein